MSTSDFPAEVKKTAVKVPFQHSYTMPSVCTCCGAAPVHGYTNMWRPPVFDPVTKKMTLYRFPLCNHCKNAMLDMMGISWPYILSSVIIALIFLWAAFTWNIVVGFEFLFVGLVIYYIVRGIRSSRIRKNPNHTSRKVMNSVGSKMEEPGKVSFFFSNADFARQFASLNAG